MFRIPPSRKPVIPKLKETPVSKYVFYLHGLAGLTTDAAWQDDEAAAHTIGSLDRLHRVKLPRCRKEVEDAIAALSNPNYVTITQQWQERCDRLQAERDEYHNLLDAAEEARKNPPIVVDGDAFMQMKKDYIEAFGADNYGMLRQHIDAHTRRADGSLDADLAYSCPNTSFFVVEVTKPDGSVTPTTVAAFAAGLYIHVPTDAFTLNDLYGLGIAVGDTYTVQIKCIVGMLAGFTPPIEFTVVECCDPWRKGVCLSFMNKYGVADTVLLAGEVTRTQTVTSEAASVPLLHSQTSHSFEVAGAGGVRYNTSGRQGFIIETKLPNKQAMWLRDLLRSPEAYYNIPYSMRGWIERQAVTVIDTTQKVSKSGTGLIDFSLKIEMSNGDIVQTL
jgi:hypothetical protein